MRKTAGSGNRSISQGHGSGDPDPTPHHTTTDLEMIWPDGVENAGPAVAGIPEAVQEDHRG